MESRIPPRVRGRYLAPLGAVFGFAARLGPLVGGWITDALGWRWVFWVFLPVGVGAWAAIAVALDLPRRVRRFGVDCAGLVLSATGATGIVLIVTWGGTALAWASPVTVGLAAVTVTAWALLVPVERRAADPIMPLRVLRNHTFVVATVISTLMAGCMFGIYGFLPT